MACANMQHMIENSENLSEQGKSELRTLFKDLKCPAILATTSELTTNNTNFILSSAVENVLTANPEFIDKLELSKVSLIWTEDLVSAAKEMGVDSSTLKRFQEKADAQGLAIPLENGDSIVMMNLSRIKGTEDLQKVLNHEFHHVAQVQEVGYEEYVNMTEGERETHAYFNTAKDVVNYVERIVLPNAREGENVSSTVARKFLDLAESQLSLVETYEKEARSYSFSINTLRGKMRKIEQDL